MSQMQQPQAAQRQVPQVGQGGPRGQMFPTQHYLSQDIREAVVEMLNQCLADTTDLMTQAKAAHWNVKGIEFFQLHELFDEIAEVLEEQADLIAERATALGGQATGTARQAASRSRIPELPQNVVAGPQLVEELANHLAIHDANLHEQINRATEYGDLDTADLLNEVSREISKQLYFLESHLQVESPRGVQWGQQVAIGQGGASQLGFGQQTQGGAGQQYQGVVGQQSR